MLILGWSVTDWNLYSLYIFVYICIYMFIFFVYKICILRIKNFPCSSPPSPLYDYSQTLILWASLVICSSQYCYDVNLMQIFADKYFKYLVYFGTDDKHIVIFVLSKHWKRNLQITKSFINRQSSPNTNIVFFS